MVKPCTVSVAFVAFLSILVLPEQIEAASAQPHAILILDQRPTAATLNRVYSFPEGNGEPLKYLQAALAAAVKVPSDDTINAVLLEARRLTGDQTPDIPVPKGADAAPPATTPDRWIATRGAVLHVYVIYTGVEGTPTPTVTIDEATRASTLAQDLATALQVAKKVVQKAPERVQLYARDYTLTKTRATLQITVRKGEKTEETKSESAAPELKATLITGPAEHWFLSADLPITNATQMAYDETSHQLVSKGIPTTFYFAVDYALGDLLSPERRWWEGITLKGLLKVSKTPLDSYGFSLGYRLRNTKLIGIELDAFSPFLAVLWTKQDAVSSDNTAQPESEYHANFRFGVSFNLDKALAWVSK